MVKIYVERRKDNGTNLIVKSEKDGKLYSKKYNVAKLKVSMRQRVVINSTHDDEEAQSIRIPGIGQIVFLCWSEMIDNEKCIRYQAFEERTFEQCYMRDIQEDEPLNEMPNGIPYYETIESTSQDDVWIAKNTRDGRQRFLMLYRLGGFGLFNKRSIWFNRLISERYVDGALHYIVAVNIRESEDILCNEIAVLDDALHTLSITGISDYDEDHLKIKSYIVRLENDGIGSDDRCLSMDYDWPPFVLNIKNFGTGWVVMATQQCGRGYEEHCTYHYDEDDIFYSRTSRCYMSYIPLRRLGAKFNKVYGDNTMEKMNARNS